MEAATQDEWKKVEADELRNDKAVLGYKKGDKEAYLRQNYDGSFDAVVEKDGEVTNILVRNSGGGAKAILQQHVGRGLGQEEGS